ncbi:AraC family transcriptional regulator [Sphingomonas hankookensis]|nr:helix-turn-helix transcriptional regulator [Sphingomonas hankookensis]
MALYVAIIVFRGERAMKHSQDVLTVDRPVVALQDEYPAGFVDTMHRHGHVQLLYASAGVMSVRTPERSFVVPPQRAVWLPVDTDHEVNCRGAVSLRTLYLRPDICPGHGECRVFDVSDFLRALILEVGRFPPEYDPGGREGRIVMLLLEEIARMPDAQLNIRMPNDPRLLRVCTAILENPSDIRDVDDWAAVAGMGRRTFTRSFRRETGSGLGTWRQQARLMEALSLIAIGKPITTVAFDVGYESASGFSAMFRRSFGTSPRNYCRTANL